PPPQDTKKYVFEGGNPTYHTNKKCERFTSNFINLEIPPEIADKGDESIKRFRAFCKENMDLLVSDESRFKERLSIHFLLKNPPNKISHNNSGSVEFQNLSLEELESLIDQLLEDADAFRNRDKDTAKLIRNKGYGTDRAKEAKIEGNPLFIWHNKYKTNLKRLLQEYFRVKLNPDLKFEGELLEQLGFKPCHNCNS
ncbi:hypothetical protein, partial [Oceanisphaera marina]|uniref:hypothetical protein n=1 Tax=Oceanisphaera marina TaxID=2017550 RepID=UPI00166AAAF8